MSPNFIKKSFVFFTIMIFTEYYNNGAYKVFFNASDYAKMESDEEKNFFKFLAGHEAENDLTKTIDEKVNFAKLNMEWKKIYMTWQQTIDEEKDIAFEEGVRQGIERGIYKKSVEAALVLIRNYNVPAETAAQQMGAPLDMVLTELERTDVN